MAAIKRESVHVADLLPPWKAFRSLKRAGKIFYFNTITRESSWEMPSFTDLDNVTNPSVTACTRKNKRKKKCKTANSSAKLMAGVNNVKEEHTDSLGVTSSSDTLMEVDDNGDEPPLLSQIEEPMEVDVVEEVNAFRQDFVDATASVLESTLFPLFKKQADVSMFLKEKVMKRNCVLVVVDTCALLQGITILGEAVYAGICLVVPYIVLKELDGLKSKGSVRLRAAVGRVNNFLIDLSTNASEYVFLENFFEHQRYLKEFTCANNDDMIMKCALVTKMRCEVLSNVIDVYLATDDKNLALKSRAAQLPVLFHELSAVWSEDLVIKPVIMDIVNIVHNIQASNKILPEVPNAVTKFVDNVSIHRKRKSRNGIRLRRERFINALNFVAKRVIANRLMDEERKKDFQGLRFYVERVLLHEQKSIDSLLQFVMVLYQQYCSKDYKSKVCTWKCFVGNLTIFDDKGAVELRLKKLLEKLKNCEGH